MSSCGAKSSFRMSKESRIAVLLVNCTFTCLMSFAPLILASTAVATPSALMVRRNEPMSPSLTVLPFSKASITSYCKASNTAFTSALDTVERFSICFTIFVPALPAWSVQPADKTSLLFSVDSSSLELRTLSSRLELKG